MRQFMSAFTFVTFCMSFFFLFALCFALAGAPFLIWGSFIYFGALITGLGLVDRSI